MSLKCKVGLHSWNGCKCSECDKTRDEEHNWSKDCEKCSNCGKTLNAQHDWSKNCHKCSKCGITREDQHDWVRCKCSKCGRIRPYFHDWSKDAVKCRICGEIRESIPHTLTENLISNYPLIEKLISNFEPIFIEGLTEAVNIGDKHAVEAIREAIRVRSRNSNVSFYLPKMKVSSGKDFLDRTLTAEQEIIELAKRHRILTDPAKTGALIASVITMNPYGADDLLTQIYEVGKESDGYDFQLVYNELIVSNRLRNSTL